MNELPTVGDVLRFYSQFWRKKQTDSAKETLVANALENLYRSKNQLTVCKAIIRRKIKREVGNLTKILKFKSKNKTNNQIQKEIDFKSTLSNTFNITKISNGSNSEESVRMEIDEPNESGIFTFHEISHMLHHFIICIFVFSLTILDHIEVDSENEDDHRFDQDDSQDYRFPSDGDDEPSDDEIYCTKKKKDIPNHILWQMCKTGVSFCALSQILKLGYSVLGESENYRLSSSHIFKTYQRIMEAKEMEYNRDVTNKNSFGTLCFDHHSMKQLSGKFIAKEDRLVVLWHCDSEDKLLSIEKIANKSGRNQAESIVRACDRFNIRQHRIVALSCDNENTNTGNMLGTCILFEGEMEKEFLRVMCRHHIYEIDLKSVYRYLFPSEMPKNVFHSILTEMWPEIKSNNFRFDKFNAEDEEMMGIDGESLVVYTELKDRASLELQTHSNHPFIRDDYKEITSLCIKFLTGIPTNLTKSNQVQFNALQNPSNARFMASSIQGLNCFLFRHQLNWDSPERELIYQQLPRFCMFLVLIYVRYWNRSNSLFDAGINDLKYLKEVEEFAIIDQGISEVAIGAMSRHLHYLGEELILLSLFSDKISINEKNEIARKLLQIGMDITERNLQSNHIKFNEIVENWNTKQIVDFVGKRSLYLFYVFNISTDFLEVGADEWNENPDYLNAKCIISNALVCVNDSTERVISTCKFKYKRQRCKNDTTFHRSMLENFMTL